MDEPIIIEKLVFDLELGSEQEYHQLARLIESQVYEQLLSELEKVLPELLPKSLSAENQLIERLDITLTPIKPQAIEAKELLQNIRKNLKQQVSVNGKSHDAAPKEQKPRETVPSYLSTAFSRIKSSPLSSFQSFQQYLLIGKFINGLPISQEFVQKAVSQVEVRLRLIQWIRNLPREDIQQKVLRRLLYILPEENRIAFLQTKEIEEIPALLIPDALKKAILSKEVESKERKVEHKEQSTPLFSSSIKQLPEAEKGLYVAHAGVIILAPFLQSLFQKSNLLNTNSRNFSRTEAAFYAIHLLEYLVTQASLETEDSALLFKVLCGVPLDEPIPLAVKVLPDDKQRATNLLKQVVSQWDIKLGKISILRGSFLIREGKLIDRKDHFQLLVDVKMYDKHLFPKLPWSFRRTQFPWMQKLLLTDWY